MVKHGENLLRMTRHGYWICVSGFTLTSKEQSVIKKGPRMLYEPSRLGANAKALTEENKNAIKHDWNCIKVLCKDQILLLKKSLKFECSMH